MMNLVSRFGPLPIARSARLECLARAKCALYVERSKNAVKSLFRKGVRERTFLPSHPKARAFARAARTPRRKAGKDGQSTGISFNTPFANRLRRQWLATWACSSSSFGRSLADPPLGRMHFANIQAGGWLYCWESQTESEMIESARCWRRGNARGECAAGADSRDQADSNGGADSVAKDGERLLAEEPELIRDAQKGDRSAFAVLVERYWDRLYRWLYHLTRDAHAAEDLAQESFMKAFAAIDRFQAGTNFRAWLFRIGHNNFVNLHRAKASHRQPLPPESPSRQEGPIDETLSREALQHLAAAVAKLPTEFRAAFLLRVEEGLSFRSMAAVLNTTEETARWRVFKARQRLLQTMSPDLFPASHRPKPEVIKEDTELEEMG